jgi:hypothetical protein
MTDTNGNVAASHMTTYQGVQVSIAILPDLRAAGDQFRAEGHTFGIILPDGGYRSLATQQDEHDHPAAHKISAAMAKRLADVGKSTHGFGRSVDVTSNTSQANINRIMTAHGFHHPYTWDPPHWEWGNALVAATVNTSALNNKPEDDMTHIYIERPTGPGGKAQWAFIGVEFPDGAIVTQEVTVAKGWAAFDPSHGTVLDDTHWGPTLAQAKVNSDAYWARVAAASNGAGAEPVTVKVAQQIADAVVAGLAPHIDALPAEIDRYADGRKQAS